MHTDSGSTAQRLFILLLVAGVTGIGFVTVRQLHSFFQDAVPVDVRYGTLAEQGVSVLIASAAVGNPSRLASESYLASASVALVVFEDEPVSVQLGGGRADLAWLDTDLKVKTLDAGRAAGSVTEAPSRSPFLLILPDGYAEQVNLRSGERLNLL